MTAARRVVVELAPRVALAVVVWHRFPVLFWNDADHYWHAFHAGGLPYREFLWEFPPLTIVPMALAVVPLWLFGPALATTMAACEVGALHLVRRGRPRAEDLTRYWLTTGWVLVLFAYFRFDFLAVVLAVGAFVAWERGRRGGWVVATLGFLAKLWPVALAVVALARRQVGEVTRLAVAVGAVTLLWFAWSPSGFRAFLDFRRGSGVHVESVVGPFALLSGSRPTFVSGAWVVGAGSLDWVDPVLLALLAVLVLAIVVSAVRRPVRPAPLAGHVVTLVLLCSRLLSPQYLVWVLPFAAIDRVDGRGVAARWFAVAAYLTLIPLLWHAEMLDGNRVLAGIVMARNAALVGVAFGFLDGLRRGGSDERDEPPDEGGDTYRVAVRERVHPRNGDEDRGDDVERPPARPRNERRQSRQEQHAVVPPGER
jgi:hypothetical protein